MGKNNTKLFGQATLFRKPLGNLKKTLDVPKRSMSSLDDIKRLFVRKI